MSDAIKMAQLDILTMKTYAKTYIIIFVYPIIFSWWAPVMMALASCFMLAVTATSIFSVQEKNNMDRLYGVLHLRGGSVVAGRYLFTLLHLLAAFVVSAPMYLIAATVTGRAVDMGELGFAYGLGAFSYCILCSVQMPIFFRFSYTKARMWAYSPFLLFALIPAAVKLFPDMGSWGVSRALLGLLERAEMHPWGIGLLFAGVGMVVLLVSVPVSMGCRRRRTAV